MTENLKTVVLVAALLLFGGCLNAQETKTVKEVSGNSVEISKYTLVPEATETCSPEECQWWEQLRNAANEVQASGGRKSLERYVNLFALGLEKSYQVPLLDRPAQLLVSTGPIQRNPIGGPKRNGTVELSVEIRIDGSVGEVKVVSGIEKGLDRACSDAVQRKAIFLPAVKDRKFVSEVRSMKFGFSSQGGIVPKPSLPN